jgi:hypothetical protein
MTSTELERRLRERLQAGNLLQMLDEYKSQFMEFPDGLFAELVLTVGSRLVEVQSIAREVRESLKRQGIELDVVVRSSWKIQEIEGPRPVISVSGGLRAAWAFPATLVSGKQEAVVEVDVTQPAIEEIRRRVADASSGLNDEKAAATEVVREFLNFQLSLGGESYWDPIRDPKQELNESALSYLIGHAAVGKS